MKKCDLIVNVALKCGSDICIILEQLEGKPEVTYLERVADKIKFELDKCCFIILTDVECNHVYTIDSNEVAYIEISCEEE